MSTHLKCSDKIFWQKINKIKGISSDSNMSTDTLQYQAKFESDNKNMYEPGNTPLNLPFSFSEFKSILATRRDYAAGSDVHSYQMFKHLPNEVLDIWMKQYNKVLNERGIP